jgi:hypothetical protein|tara:strand:+ start:1071 stop:1442 length:372 start_codon:yes stop_codon:yes gene_type:complete
MATLTPTLTLASSDMNGDLLNLLVTDTLTVLGQVTTKQVVATQTGVVFAAAANYTKAFVYLKNHSVTPSEIITIEKADGGDEYLFLGAGEFAFFPWASIVDLALDAATGSPVLEVRIYQEAAA